MQQTWRWFGPGDSVTLDDIRQTGASGLVSSLGHIAIGDTWPLEEIKRYRNLIEGENDRKSPLKWTVVESVPVHDAIKAGLDSRDDYIQSFCTTLENLANAGIDTVCYNFMPVIDWTRTDLDFELPNGARALKFDADRFAAFDLFILKRTGAESDYDDDEISRAKSVYQAMGAGEQGQLIKNIIAGLPGRMTDSHELAGFRKALLAFAGIDDDSLRQNLFYFLERVVPVAEAHGVKLCIHPDDPPRRLLGLPRVVCTAADVRKIFSHVNSLSNGLTLCAGTFGVRADNDLPAMAREFAHRIHFAHLRGTTRSRTNPRTFYEADHLDSDIDMVAVIRHLLEEESRRRAVSREDHSIPIRPDHGHQMLDDLQKTGNPGYSAIGRLKGLAEIRGVIAAVLHQQPR